MEIVESGVKHHNFNPNPYFVMRVTNAKIHKFINMEKIFSLESINCLVFFGVFFLFIFV